MVPPSKGTKAFEASQVLPMTGILISVDNEICMGGCALKLEAICNFLHLRTSLACSWKTLAVGLQEVL